MVILFGYYVIRSPINKSYFTIALIIINGRNPLELINAGAPTAFPTPGNASQVVSAESIVSDLFAQRNFTKEEKVSLYTWNRLKHLINDPQDLPNAVEAIKEAGVAWGDLVTSVEEEKLRSNGKEKQCPPFLTKMNASELDGNDFKLWLPCGLTQDSSITLIGIPNSLLGKFQVNLTGERLPGEPDPPIILHYNANGSDDSSRVNDEKPRTYFPFEQNEIFVATFTIGLEGIQMTVDGKHVTSFAYRDTLEPWLIREVWISGDVNLTSVVASGLPTSEDLEQTVDLEALKAVPITPRRQLNLFIGVFSGANYFNRRMAVRRSWMQYPEVRSGQVAVRFFVGLHNNKTVNEELWNEARTYGDVQLMPFVDYYTLLTWKTIAVCIFGTEVVSAKFIMKTDDEAFVRVNELLSSLGRTNMTPFAHGPGYVLSNDIARTVSKKHRKGSLKLFKLEDVAMGMWIADMKKKGMEVRYEMDNRISIHDCKDGYVLAHYQTPRQLLCLWQKIQETKRAVCCNNKHNTRVENGELSTL